MKIMSSRTIKLSASSTEVHLDSGFSTCIVEPEGDIGACCLDEGSCERIRDILLDDFG